MKKIWSTPILVLSLCLGVALVAPSCSSVTPQALSVDGWSLSDSDFQSQMSNFAAVYKKANGSDSDLRAPDGASWSTSFTSAFLNDHLSLRLAQIDAAKRGIVLTDADRAQAQSLLEKNFSTQAGDSFFSQLDASYRTALINGVAAQNALAQIVIDEASTDDALRRAFDAAGDKYAGEQACASHILIFAGSSQGQSTPTAAEYAAALTKIQSIQAQLKGTSNFADLATANSDDTGSGAKGGDLGCNPKGAFVSEFDSAVWSQPIGTVGVPVKTKYGYHLILVRSRGTLTFADVKADLAAAVKTNVSALLAAELAGIATDRSIGVDGRYGQFQVQTGTIVAPAGAMPATSSIDTTSLNSGPTAANSATQ